jgi:5-methylcytosine-specific restriction enzyme subunit McrC
MYIYEYSEVDSKLQNYIVKNKKLHKYFSFNWDVLKTRQYCGILNIDGEDIYLLPKISNKADKTNLSIFIYMLIYAYDMQLENEDLASCKNENQTILEVFVQLFAKQLFKQLQMGIYKEYITEQDNLTTLRGKYLVNENIRHNFTNSKIYCEYDEFSMNNELNQFFLYAIKTLQHFVKDIRVLKQCELVLDEVEYRSFDIENLHIHFHRLNYRFQESFEFAILLLKQSIPLFSKEKKSFAFLFDMNILFEKFVARMIKENFDDVEVPKKSKKFGELYLKPDIIVKSKKLLIDCKYKIIKDDKIAKRDDRYQMYVYANNFEEVNITMLLYPKHLDDEIDQLIILGENDRKVRLQVKCFDLDVKCESYEEYVELMKERVKLL